MNTTEEKKNIEAVKRLFKIEDKPKQKYTKSQMKYLRNSKTMYAVRIWFQKEEAEEVRSFLEAIRSVSTQFNSGRFIRESILKAIREAKKNA